MCQNKNWRLQAVVASLLFIVLTFYTRRHWVHNGNSRTFQVITGLSRSVLEVHLYLKFFCPPTEKQQTQIWKLLLLVPGISLQSSKYSRTFQDCFSLCRDRSWVSFKKQLREKWGWKWICKTWKNRKCERRICWLIKVAVSRREQKTCWTKQ